MLTGRPPNPRWRGGRENRRLRRCPSPARPMARVHEQITPELRAFIAEQPLFFVATVPLAG
jgi:hypothetical protein